MKENDSTKVRERSRNWETQCSRIRKWLGNLTMFLEASTAGLFPSCQLLPIPSPRAILTPELSTSTSMSCATFHLPRTFLAHPHCSPSLRLYCFYYGNILQSSLASLTYFVCRAFCFNIWAAHFFRACIPSVSPNLVLLSPSTIF